MVTLAEELAADQTASPILCHICTWLATQPAEVRRNWADAFQNKAFSHASVLRALERRDVQTSDGGVKRHRRNHA